MHSVTYVSNDPWWSQTNRTEQMRSVATVPNNLFIMHSYLTCYAFCLDICTEDHNRLYRLHIRKLFNSHIYIKRHLRPIYTARNFRHGSEKNGTGTKKCSTARLKFYSVNDFAVPNITRAGTKFHPCLALLKRQSEYG